MQWCMPGTLAEDLKAVVLLNSSTLLISNVNRALESQASDVDNDRREGRPLLLLGK